ncbi:hypothetical protein [Tateyamaria sp. SN3-11]|uniref:hypothetical protein n=1 Tax=Tateyamaria sp. SN3-11 TaxID=3092147 RepID=UPI0039ED8C18
MTYTLIPGQSHTASEEETLSMIRSVLTEDTEPTPKRKRARKAAAPKAEVQTAFVERSEDPNPRRRAEDLPELEQVAEPTQQPRTSRGPGLGARLKPLLAAPIARVRAFRPTTRHLAIVSVLLLLVVRPHWFVIGAVLMLALVIGTFLILGSDRIWRGVLSVLTRIEARNPARAQELRTKLDGFAYRWDAVLDIFPDGMVDGLYMPDFQAMQEAEEAHAEAVGARLERMMHEG